MKPLTIALFVVLALNLFLLLFQTSITKIGGDANFYNYDDSMLSRVDAGDMVLNDTRLENLPNSVEGESAELDTKFTDIFKTAKNWVFEKTGLSYLLDILNAPNTLLTMMGVPKEVSYSIGALWWLFTFFVIVSWLLGKE